MTKEQIDHIVDELDLMDVIRKVEYTKQILGEIETEYFCAYDSTKISDHIKIILGYDRYKLNLFACVDAICEIERVLHEKGISYSG